MNNQNIYVQIEPRQSMMKTIGEPGDWHTTATAHICDEWQSYATTWTDGTIDDAINQIVDDVCAAANIHPNNSQVTVAITNYRKPPQL